MGFTTTAEDDDFVLERLTAELADELRSAGEVDYVPMPARPGDKGVAEVAVATLSVLTAVDQTYLRLLVEGVVAFTNRNAGRRVQLKVGDTELTIDRPTQGEVETVIKTVQRAVERDRF
ncbi:MAG: hypothetical protein M3Q39_13660 [Actinomycetota bacterium]|nr:hypothetical protein [Actinomycetota bacterium]